MPAMAAEKTEPFAASRELFSAMESYLMSKDARNLTHSELEREIEKRGLELMRSLLQAHLDVRGRSQVPMALPGSGNGCMSADLRRSLARCRCNAWAMGLRESIACTRWMQI